MTKRIKMPFDCVIMDKESQEITNPYTGYCLDSCKLSKRIFCSIGLT